MTRLKEIRQEKGLSQSKFAEKAGLSVRTLQDYEQGRRSINGASALTVYIMAQALECSVEDILDI